MNIKKITGIFLFLSLLIILGYDVFAFLAGGTESTISFTIFKLSHKYPALSFGVGFVCGHLFWQMPKTDKIIEKNR